MKMTDSIRVKDEMRGQEHEIENETGHFTNWFYSDGCMVE